MNHPENKTHAAEKLLVGSILAVGRNASMADLAEEAIAKLAQEHFVFHPCRLLFEAISELHEASRPITSDSVLIHLERAGKLADLGNDPAEYIQSLVRQAGVGSQLNYAMISVIDESRRRELNCVGLNIIAKCQQPEGSVDEAIAEAYLSLFELESRSSGANEPVSSAIMATRAKERLDASSTPGWKPETFNSGLGRLDFVANFRPGQLVVIGARPSVGKSAVLMTLANGFVEHGVPTLFFSLEMTEEEHTNRVISQLSGVPIAKLTGRQTLDDEAAELVVQSLRSFAKMKFWMDDRDTPTAAAIVSKSRRYARRHGVRVVMVDYLQLVAPANPREQRYLQVGEVARTLKAFAQKDKLLVICAAQLNREVESRPNSAPRISDLRDSGEIEQHANTVILLSRPTPEATTLQLDVAKNRGGITDNWQMDFDRAKMRFTERIF